MSMDAYVFSDRRLNSLPEWQRVIEAERLDVVLPMDGLIGELRGFLPVHSNGVATGFECSPCDAAQIMALYSAVHFDRSWAHCLAFTWRGDLDECLAASSAAAAYAKATGGVVFDPQDSLVMSDQQALQLARQMNTDKEKWKRTIADAVAKVERLHRARG
jgi:hypothetical protein